MFKHIHLLIFVCVIFFVFFFFFQAEDGIRDLTVTGVQTCALPIFVVRGAVSRPVPLRGIEGAQPWRAVAGSRARHARRAPGLRGAVSAQVSRSEEHTSELQSQSNLVCRLLLEKKKKTIKIK